MSYSNETYEGYFGAYGDADKTTLKTGGIAPKASAPAAPAPAAPPAEAPKEKAPVKLISFWMLGALLIALFAWKKLPDITR